MALFIKKPAGFEPSFEAVGCYIQRGDHFLYLHKRLDHRLYPNQWGIPAGKVEKGEDISMAIQREVEEETGIILPDAIMFKSLGPVYVTHPVGAFVYHVYYAAVEMSCGVIIDPEEHCEYAWLTLPEIMEKDLIQDEKENFRHFATAF